MANELTPESLGFIGGFGPAPEPGVDPLSNIGRSLAGNTETTQVEDKTKENKIVDKKDEKVQTSNQPNKQSLADILRADREARESRNKETTEIKNAKDELVKVKTELDTLRNSPSFEKDPIAYCRSHNISKEEQVALGESLIYDIVPDKAPADLRLRLYENKRQREDKLRTEQEKELQAKRDVEVAQRNLEEFTNSLDQAARTLQSGAFPESEDWFVNDNGDLDHTSYVRSLLATANNLSIVASSKKMRADLSFENIAKTLETEIAKRQAKREEMRSKRNTDKTGQANKPVERNTERVVESKSPVETISTKGLNSGSVEKPSWDDAERVRRAVLAGWQ